MSIWIYNGDTDHPIDNASSWTDSAGTQYPGAYPKGEVAGMRAVVYLPSTGAGTVITYGPIVLNNGRYERAVALSPEPVTTEMVQAECSRRLALGFNYDFGDARGVHRIGMSDRDRAGWGEVNDIAQVRINTSDTAPITIATDTGVCQVTPMEWQVILKAAGDSRQPLWMASFWLQAQSLIPYGYTDDSYWSMPVV